MRGFINEIPEVDAETHIGAAGRTQPRPGAVSHSGRREEAAGSRVHAGFGVLAKPFPKRLDAAPAALGERPFRIFGPLPPRP
jgi:hypothetical protein